MMVLGRVYLVFGHYIVLFAFSEDTFMLALKKYANIIGSICDKLLSGIIWLLFHDDAAAAFDDDDDDDDDEERERDYAAEMTTSLLHLIRSKDEKADNYWQ